MKITSYVGGTSGNGSHGRTRKMWLPWLLVLWQGLAGTAWAPGKKALAAGGCPSGRLWQPSYMDDGMLPRPMQELLGALHQQRPRKEGIFCKAESASVVQELWQALDHGLPVDMASQLVLLLAVILKGGQDVAGCQPAPPGAAAGTAAHISQHASTSHTTCSNPAICLGPNLLNALQEKQLELHAMPAENDKAGLSSDGKGCLAHSQAPGLSARLFSAQVKVLVDFMLENADDIFGEETAGPEESRVPTEVCTGRSKKSCAGKTKVALQAEQTRSPTQNSCPHASTFLPEIHQEDSIEATVLKAKKAEPPPDLPPSKETESSTEALDKAGAPVSLPKLSSALVKKIYTNDQEAY
ncbi:hypothetical protein DUI87_05061 [Hirundo rustica rustica]|uniref:Uncharacterized protein n=1 Tax=Hirundo rustica rustica TaxID=333673 RepID=A0A3M0L5B1_HIRRU|nr:hypothetical protein DUI87_05061 [Hirundo rustica rustica]